MKLAPSAPGASGLRRAAVGFAAAAAVISTAGCSAINYQATTHQYSASDGVRADIGEVQFRHIMLVANEEGGDARLLGSVNNRSSEDVSIEIEATGESLSFDLEPGEMANLEHDGEHIVSSVEVPPGGMQPATLSVNGEAQDVEATVHDGALEEYRAYAEDLDGFDMASSVGHLDHCPVTWGSGAAHDPHVSQEEVEELCSDFMIEYAQQREGVGHLGADETEDEDGGDED
ncbi:hypothetical protein [Nesterenkonia populi]|uniref:hypothetical protein n=1 Tax=Nesterenkonia populi TaxID=1591087 RepID=UPI0011BD7412|nr:hypothetical protein [Nesterenkonia populi]